RKFRAYLAVLIPVVVKSLVRAYGMAALLHVRGYGSGRRVRTPQQLTATIVACYAAGALWVAAALVMMQVLR
ncbi:MAG: hypothetical protein Q8S43_09905, partial [Actinomycetota bacterium]|nr:hypothetical protein [Actinomycetota bacterium]